MRLEKILDKLNSFEKNSFLKILDNIISERPTNNREVEKILSNYSDRGLKNLDSHIVARVFSLIEYEYYNHLDVEINSKVSQLDLLIDILIRDGNCIMSREWLDQLYSKEIKSIGARINSIKPKIAGTEREEMGAREKEYFTYYKCVQTAHRNDLEQNLDPKITKDEKSILNTLATALNLSQEEVKLLNYSVLPLKRLPINELIDLLKNSGIILYSKKNHVVYIPDELVRILRKFRGKSVADKYLKRMLKLLREPQINVACKKHGIDRKNDKSLKIKQLINEGLSLKLLFKQDLHKEGTNVSTKKLWLNDLVEKGLKITHLKGTTIDTKLENLINYFNEIERDDKVGISMDGYVHLLNDLEHVIKDISVQIKSEFELQSTIVINPELLLDYNIKPRDVIEILDERQLRVFCDSYSISLRGNEVMNVLDSYKDAQNIQLENYSNIAYRNIALLKENGVKIKESELGIKFEELTRLIFKFLGFDVNDELRKKINSQKDKLDILIITNDKDVILGECKTVKEKGYDKFSSVSRQIKSYKRLLEKSGYNVIKSLLIAPEFSDDFISDCEIDYELNLTLIRADSLLEIYKAFKNNKKLDELPYNLFMRDVIIQEDRIIKAMNK